MRRIAQPLRACLVVTLVAVVLAFVLRAIAEARSATAAPAFGAEWIWAAGVADRGAPTAFRLVRDVEIEAPSEAAEPLAFDLAVEGTYVLWIDGLRVGSGAWGSAGIWGAAAPPSAAIAPGSAAEAAAASEASNRRNPEPMHRYAVEEFLPPGRHRIEIEARSEHGVGGVLAVLRRGREILLRSDEAWRVAFDEVPAVRAGTHDLAAAEELAAPRIWGPPPAGRWRVAAASRRVADVAPTWPLESVVRPQRVRHPTDGSDWMSLGERLPTLGDQGIFDFGRPVTGFLELDLPCARSPDEGARGDSSDAAAKRPEPPVEVPTALLHTSLELPAFPAPGSATATIDDLWPRDRRPDGVLVALPGACTWRDAVLRTVRYVSIAGVMPKGGMRMVAVAEDRVEALAAGRRGAGRERRGAFGLEPARGWSPIEERVWDRLGRGETGGGEAGGSETSR